jgi:hypothetical protein
MRIPASEVTRKFGGYRMLAQREAVAVSSHGSIAGYFIARKKRPSVIVLAIERGRGHAHCNRFAGYA